MLFYNTRRKVYISKNGLCFPPLHVVNYDTCNIQDFRILSLDKEWGINNIVNWLGLPITLKRMSALGDILITSAVAQALVSEYKSDVFFITSTDGMGLLKCIKGVIPESPETYFNNRNIKWIIDLDVLRENYEFALDGKEEYLQKNRIEITYEYLGMQVLRTSPDIFLNDDVLNLGYNFVCDLRRPVIIVAPSSSWLCKMWRRMPEFISRLLAEGYSVIVLDKKLWFEPPDGSYIFIDCPVEVGISLLFHSDILLTHDSFWMHVAGALGVPQVVLCSCTDGRVNAKYYNADIIQGNSVCSPCWYKFKNGCSSHEFPRCLDAITVDTVLEHVIGGLN